MMKSPRRSSGRLAFALSVVGLAALGLIWRRQELGLPWALAKYGGSMLWGSMVFCCVAVALGRASLLSVAVIAAAASAALEASQLLSYAPLDAFRRTAAGALLLGRTFDGWDIAAYWVGIGLASLAASVVFTRAKTGTAGRTLSCKSEER